MQRKLVGTISVDFNPTAQLLIVHSAFVKYSFGVIHWHSASNNDPNVGQFVDVLKTDIISGLTFRGLSNKLRG